MVFWGCGSSSADKQQPVERGREPQINIADKQQPVKREREPQINIVDFIDNTSKYKGQTIKLRLIVDEPVFRDEGRFFVIVSVGPSNSIDSVQTLM